MVGGVRRPLPHPGTVAKHPRGAGEPSFTNLEGCVSPVPTPVFAREDLWGRQSGDDLLATYYVSTTGKDTAAGTLANPYKTLTKAAGVAAAGDRVLVRGGSYFEQVKIGRSGSATTPIEFGVYPGETVVIDGSKTARGTDLVSITGSHVAFRGFKVVNAKRTGIALWAARGVTLSRNTVTGCVRGGIWMGASDRTTSGGHTISQNKVYMNCLENAARSWSGGWPRAIAVDASDQTVVDGNHVFQNYGEGIGALSSYGTNIKNNYVYDNYSVMIYLDNAPWSYVQNNYLFTTGDSRFYRSGKPAVSVLIANEQTTYPLASSNITVSPNTIAGLVSPYYDASYGLGGGLSAGVLAPNTVVSASAVKSTWLAA